MSQEEVFDSFYRSSRTELVLQTFLFTGDLTAATAAVRDAFAITWQHWKKVTRREAVAGETPADYVRPLAYRIAQRRHAGRIWHRNRGLTDEHRLVLDTIHRLSPAERRLFLVVELGGVQLPDAAREVQLTLATAERRLAHATSEVASALGPAYGERLRALAEPAAAAALPRASIVLRAGRERRRVQTVLAVAGAVGLTVGLGFAAREPGLGRASAAHQVAPDPTPSDEPEGIRLTTPSQLLQAYQLGDLAPQQLWTEKRTDTNTRGDGINTICQQTRYADPKGLSALVRIFDASGRPARRAVQSVEISKDTAAADKAYATTIGWFASCSMARLQMVSAYRVTGVGEQAELLRVEVADSPSTVYDVAVARVRATTVTLVVRTAGAPAPKAATLATTLGDAVSKLCPADAPTCVTSPAVAAVPPPRSGDEPGFVASVDLPAVSSIAEPWVGVPSVNVLRGRDATTRCDRAMFAAAGAVKARARTFVIPQADMPETFGFTESYAIFKSPKAASRFLHHVRSSVAGCPDRDLTIKVTEARSDHGRIGQSRYDLSVWRFDNKVSDKLTVSFRVGFVQVGGRVAKLVLVPDGKNDIAPTAFRTLTHRAAERLLELG